jgi:hypothetical protein
VPAARPVGVGLVVEGVPAGTEVGAGAERPPGPGDDDGPDGVVGIGRVEGL